MEFTQILLTIIYLVVGIGVFGGGLYLGIRLVGHSARNNIWLALAIGAVFGTCGAFAGYGPFFLLPLVALLYLLVKYYELGIGQSIVVVMVLGAVQFLSDLVLEMTIVPLLQH